MLLESALKELSIDLNREIYVDNVVLEMCSPSESLSQRTASKESSKDAQTPDPAEEQPHSTPGSVPFGWEIEPGVPRKPKSEKSESHSPLRLPPSAYTSPSSSSSRGYLTWNISPGRRHLSLATSAHEKTLNEYDGDDESIEADSNGEEYEYSPVSTLDRMSMSPNIDSLPSMEETIRNSPPPHGELGSSSSSSGAKSCATLLWGVFPCSSKCFFVSSCKHKEKGRAISVSSSDGGHEREREREREKSGMPVASALKKKSGCSGWGGTKQVRFSVEETETANSNGGALSSAAAQTHELEWASYGLF